MQTFVLSKFEPTLVFLAEIATQAIVSGRGAEVWAVFRVLLQSEIKGLCQDNDPGARSCI